MQVLLIRFTTCTMENIICIQDLWIPIIKSGSGECNSHSSRQFYRTKPSTRFRHIYIYKISHQPTVKSSTRKKKGYIRRFLDKKNDVIYTVERHIPTTWIASNHRLHFMSAIDDRSCLLRWVSYHTLFSSSSHLIDLISFFTVTKGKMNECIKGSES